MKNIKTKGLRLGLMVLLLIGLCAADGFAKDTMVMALVEGSYGGIPKEMMNKIRTELTAALTKKTGKKFEIKIYPTVDALWQAAKKGEIDFVMAGVDYPLARANGVPLKPLATLEIKGKYKFSDCFWVAASSPYKTLKDLDGKVLVMNVYPSLWGILLKEGIKKSPLNFFKKIYSYKDSVVALKSVLAGFSDAILMGESYMAFHQFDESLKNKFRSVACSEPLVATNLMYNSSVDPKLLEQVTLIVKNIHRDPDFQSLRFMFLSTNGTMRPVNEADFANSVEMYKKVVEAGWGKEYAIVTKAPVIDNEFKGK